MRSSRSEDLVIRRFLRTTEERKADNAMKYSEPGTVIHILGQNSAQGLIVSVRDEGIGIPAEKLDHIFDAFYQCEESHKKDGNGLGLSIVKRILELLNGSIECRSRSGTGTEMLVTIPRNMESEACP